MDSTRALVLALLVAVSMVAVPLSATAATGTPATGHDADGPAASPAFDVTDTDEDENVTDTDGSDDPATNVTYVGEDDDPQTNATIGYVEGVSYDDELAVDERDDATLEDDELEAVVHRSMARVEVIRELPFETTVPVDIVDREEFQEHNRDTFGSLTEEERLLENVRYEALFMVDRETDALEEREALYGDAVGGYYNVSANEIVLVSDDPETLAVDEVLLAHELLHALQDQHFDLGRYDRGTLDLANAKNGLIEGDAVWVETEYEERCDEEWDCLFPSEGGHEGTAGGGLDEAPSTFNWGLYFTIYQPYSDGPDYVAFLLEEGGWDAVDAAYDEPPTSSAEVIRPGEVREPAAIELEDNSSDDWHRLTVENETPRTTFGEAAMVSMLAHGALDRSADGSVVTLGDFVATDDDGYIETIEYDQPYTNGWAGDEFVVYVTDATAIDESGYVWQTEWQTSADAETFAAGYLELLAIHDASPVEEYRDTFVIDDRFPGAYYVDVDEETVTIVRAPSVDELSEIRAGAAPDGEDMLNFEVHEIESGDEIPGFGVAATLLALLALLVAAAAHRR